MLICRNVDGPAEMSGSPIKMFLSPRQGDWVTGVLFLRCPAVSNTAREHNCPDVFQQRGVNVPLLLGISAPRHHFCAYNNMGKWASALGKQGQSLQPCCALGE